MLPSEIPKKRLVHVRGTFAGQQVPTSLNHTMLLCVGGATERL